MDVANINVIAQITITLTPKLMAIIDVIDRDLVRIKTRFYMGWLIIQKTNTTHYYFTGAYRISNSAWKLFFGIFGVFV
jgi:hypothetical protein